MQSSYTQSNTAHEWG